MNKRIQDEIGILEKKYGPLEYGQSLDWILIREFLVPHGWNMNTIQILIIVPPGYPVTPPDNFCVTLGFRLESGSIPSNYSEPVQYLGKKWGQFSYHTDGDWQPKEDITSGDNLLTYVLGVVNRLKEIN